MRKDGVAKVASLKQEIFSVKRNKLIDPETRQKLIGSLKQQVGETEQVAAANSAEETRISREAVAYSNNLASVYHKQVVAEETKNEALHKGSYQSDVKKIKAAAAAEEQQIRSRTAGSDGLKEELETHRFELRSKLFDAKSKYQSAVDACRDAKNQAFVDHVQMNRNLRNGKADFAEDTALNFRNYIYKFKMSKFLLDNGLYLAILVFFIVCIILAPLSNKGNLLSLPNILTILEQASTRMFYALGVAGLILLAGTDLSVGRMVALGSVITGLLLHPGRNIVTFFGMANWDFTPLPMGVRVIMALVISVALCVLFSAFAGVFTARLKIHPFISTLATQLIIYGLLFFGTSGTPVGSIDSSIKDLLGGRWILGIMNGELITFPKLIIPAIIAVFVAWFIWNKTIFGKNMYAVGGNAEAASVSGISVFKVTMGVFIMAGIFYGFGAFFEAFKANASAGTGQGYELDAIAACVVGGISFNGGIGKIGGAVIGVIIFTGLTYCLTFLGIDTNLQFVFKGLIIIAAVALDSVKYLKKK
ncbi:MAG: galactoside ABC transporter permease [Spirochaetaceae bacterium]|nr:galactoside ABC transporter permease [Spirochaetaceae bacterium]